MNRLNEIKLDFDIEYTEFGYLDYKHEEGDVVYCDPPYIGTAKYGGRDFDHAEFWDWVRSRDYPVYVSEYTAPDDFISIWQKGIPKQMAGGKTSHNKAIEHLYIHRKWLNGEIERIVEQIVENTGNGGK